MRSNYKRLGKYIQEVNVKNSDLAVETLLGVSIQKMLIPSIANTIGSDMSKYKVIEKNQFAYGPVTSRNGDKISVALLKEYDKAIISQSYKVFEVIDEEELLQDYLMMWFSRPEFDRYARFMSHGSTRETFDWDEMCEVELPIPPIEEQRAIVGEYQTVTDRIQLNEQINAKLEEAAQALYRHWFVDFEFPDENGKPYKSSGGKMVWNEELEKEVPEGWEVMRIDEVSNLKYGKMISSLSFLPKGYPIFSGYGIRGYTDKYMYKDSQILVLCRGVSGTGRVELSPEFAHITNLSIVVEIDKEQVDKYYYYFYLKNENLRKLDSGSAQSQITTGDLGAYRAFIPNKSVQNKFGDYLEHITKSKIENSRDTKKIQRLQSLLLCKMARNQKQETASAI